MLWSILETVPFYPPANILRNHALFPARLISDDRESLFSIIIPTLSDEEENRKSPSIEIMFLREKYSFYSRFDKMTNMICFKRNKIILAINVLKLIIVILSKYVIDVFVSIYKKKWLNSRITYSSEIVWFLSGIFSESIIFKNNNKGDIYIYLQYSIFHLIYYIQHTLRYYTLYKIYFITN